MQKGNLPIGILPSWCLLNNVEFGPVAVSQLDGRGYGLVAQQDVQNQDAETEPLELLKIPNDLIVSAEGVEQFAKQNKDFRALLDAAGHRSTRCDALLFLLMQRVLSSPDFKGKLGAPTPWTQYFTLLPHNVPVPTLWSDAELLCLRGTSLESAVSAKLQVLAKEFGHVRGATSELPVWGDLLSVKETITAHDWVLFDAVYRSRSLELPGSGESLVPCLDMANHSSRHTAYFEQSDDLNVSLFLRPGCAMPSGSEVTINYGENKSAGEMLFSYGFIDTDSATKSLVLPVKLMDDDPLTQAKLHAFGSSPTMVMKQDSDGSYSWNAPFVYLMCVNEEDGLEFKVLQENDGTRHLRMFWMDDDVSDRAAEFHEFVGGHPLFKVFQIRVVVTVLDMVEEQLERLRSAAEMDVPEGARYDMIEYATQLRRIEQETLEGTLITLTKERDVLFADETVVAYLASSNAPHEEETSGLDRSEEDFS